MGSSPMRQLIFLRKSDCLGCAVLLYPPLNLKIELQCMCITQLKSVNLYTLYMYMYMYIVHHMDCIYIHLYLEKHDQCYAQETQHYISDTRGKKTNIRELF